MVNAADEPPPKAEGQEDCACENTSHFHFKGDLLMTSTRSQEAIKHF